MSMDDVPVDPAEGAVARNDPEEPAVTVPTGQAEDALGKNVYGPEVEALVGDIQGGSGVTPGRLEARCRPGATLTESRVDVEDPLVEGRPTSSAIAG